MYNPTVVKSSSITAAGVGAAAATQLPVTGASLIGLLVLGLGLLLAGFVVLRLGAQARQRA